MQTISFEEIVEQIVAKDKRYPRDAYSFVREALDHTHKSAGKSSKGKQIRHVSGQELLAGIRDFALQQFGPMAMTVLEEWGIKSCSDFGEIVFIMIEFNLLKKTEKDSRADFENGYNFHSAFREPYLPQAKVVKGLKEAKVSKA
jgi:uncharacterized repeat protein (TIGR04138 family)